MSESLVLLTRGQEIECRNPIYRPPVEAPGRTRSKESVVAGSIVADFPRRWKRSRGCKVRTAAGDFIVTAYPHPDRTIRLESGSIEKIAAALGL